MSREIILFIALVVTVLIAFWVIGFLGDIKGE